MLGWFKEENRLAAVLFDDLGWETITRVRMAWIVKWIYRVKRAWIGGYSHIGD